MSHTRKKWLLGSAAPASPARFCSTTEGRQGLPDILHDSFGLKSITGFHRYGRALGAIIPIEAVRMLAGYPDTVDEGTKLRIQNLLEGQASLRP
jgi:hypothetical protein